MDAGLIRYDRDWLNGTMGFIASASRQRESLVATASMASASVAGLSYPECAAVVTELAAAVAQLGLHVSGAAASDTAQAMQLSGLSLALGRYEAIVWDGVDLSSSTLPILPPSSLGDLDSSNWEDIYNDRAVIDLMPYVPAELDPDLASLTQSNMVAILGPAGAAAFRTLGGGDPWTIAVMVTEVRGEWSNIVRSTGGSGFVNVGGSKVEWDENTTISKRNVDLRVVASDGHTLKVTELPDTWIAGFERQSGFGGSAAVTLPKVDVGVSGGGTTSKGSSFDRMHDGEPDPERDGHTGWLFGVKVLP